MSETECPICMNCIELNANCTTTECGHRFHSSCLMKNIAHNGFCCPNCRTTMAEPVDDDDSDDYDYDDDDDDADSEGVFEDRMMRGFRMFFDNANGEEHDAADIREEIEEREEELEEEEEQSGVPSIEYITNKLSSTISYSDLVTALMSQHAEFERRVETYDSDNRIFGLIRSIIARYDPNQNPTPNPASQVKKYVQNTESCIDIFV